MATIVKRGPAWSTPKICHAVLVLRTIPLKCVLRKEKEKEISKSGSVESASMQ